MSSLFRACVPAFLQVQALLCSRLKTLSVSPTGVANSVAQDMRRRVRDC
jgi:hypothetical protein